MSEEEWTPTKPAERSRVEVRVVDDDTDDREGREPDLPSSEDGEAEEVVRLEQVPERVSEQGPVPLSNRRTADVELLPVEEGGPNRTGLGLRGLTLAMGLVAVLLTVAGVYLVVVYHGAKSGKDSPLDSLGVVELPDSILSEPDEDRYTAAEIEGFGQMAAKMAVEYSKLESVGEVVPMIMRGEELRGLLEERWEPLELSATGDTKLSGQIAEIDGRLIMSVVGLDREDKLFVLIFDHEGSDLKIDWEASMGIGDVDFEDLNKVPLGEKVRMRVFIEPSNFFPVQYPDDEYRCYRISHRYGEFPSYGYAKHGSEAVAKLAEIFNEGATLFASERLAGAIVVLENGGRGSERQFIIADVIQGGWIEKE